MGGREEVGGMGNKMKFEKVTYWHACVEKTANHNTEDRPNCPCGVGAGAFIGLGWGWEVPVLTSMKSSTALYWFNTDMSAHIVLALYTV